jgi:DNA-binding beta-propeller fold protein YncE
MSAAGTPRVGLEPGTSRAALRTAGRRALVAALLAIAAGCAPASSAAGRSGAEPAAIIGAAGLDPGRFRHPRALAVDGRGRVYVVDRTGRVQLFDGGGALLRVWRTPETANGQPVGVAIESEAALLVADTHYQRIFRYSIPAILEGAGTELSHDAVLAPPPRGRIGGELGKGPGQFTWVRDVVVDAAGSIYAGDSGGLNDRIQKFAADGRFLLEWGRRGSAPGELDLPSGMAIETAGETQFLLVADSNNHRIQRFDLEGRFVSLWGSPGVGPGALRFPRAVAVGPRGGIYVCAWGNNRVPTFTRDGASRGVWGGPGRGAGELLTPWDIDVGADGRIFVADYGNHRVQVFRWPESTDGDG